MKTLFAAFTHLILLLTASPLVMAAAANKQNEVASSLTRSPLNSGALLQTFLGLMLVLACIVLVAWLLKRSNTFHCSANGELKVIAGIALGTREKAMLLQVGKQQILIGVTAQQVQTLLVLDEPVSPASESASASGFANKLKQVMQQRGQQ